MGFFGIKGQVTPKWIVQSGQNSNMSEILCLFKLSASFTKIWLKLKRPCSGKCKICCFSAPKGKLLLSKLSDLAGIELIRDFMAVLFTCKFDVSIESERSILWTTFSPLLVYGKIFHRSRGVTLKQTVRSGLKSNSKSKISWLSSLPASLTKIQ